MFYIIEDTLKESNAKEFKKSGRPYVAVLKTQEWQNMRDSFEMGIDMDIYDEVQNTKVDVNFDSLTGTFSIPDRRDVTGDDFKFAFALDEKGIVFIDDSGTAQKYIDSIRQSKKWRMPGLERFIYDFLEQIISGDMALLDRYERELTAVEEMITKGDEDADIGRVNDIRGDLLDLSNHYEQLIDLGEELGENDNGFFREENVRYFRMFTNRVQRLRDTDASMREYTVQIRDLYQARLDVRQNRIMTVLTVVTTIFMPLTLIVGWYGMNFKYMPELEWRLGYPAVIAVSVLIAAGLLVYFKKKKWL